MLQTGRLFGAQLGAAFVQTFLRVREQIYSNLIGQHVTAGTWLTGERLQNYAQLVKGRSIEQVDANARATVLLANAVRNQAYVLAFIDGFMVLGFAVIGVLLLMLSYAPLRLRLVSFSYDLGFMELEQKTSQPLDNLFGPRLSPMS
ncbi:MAG: hypothetical protein JO068_09590 [Hyphomicrobiales bacterium]|nr:hypothetical protein [Hyphomicrobiales bacterium]